MSRVAIVTGASRGIGRASAVALAGDDRAVACAFREDERGAKETVGAIEAAGGRAAPFRVNVTDEGQVAELVRGVSETLGPPTVLVAAAGVVRDGLAVRYPLEAFRELTEVNVTGAFATVRGALPSMLRARWGRIVLVSSAVALRGNPGQAAYGSTKAGLIGMARSLAREYGGRGITVNAVAPGLIDTAMTAAMTEEARERLLAEVPAGRLGSAEEAASAIRFLASEEASYVNGAVVPVDGGMTA